VTELFLAPLPPHSGWDGRKVARRNLSLRTR
jgi:hypothetical protein